jgi:hypothetical protein
MLKNDVFAWDVCKISLWTITFEKCVSRGPVRVKHHFWVSAMVDDVL